MTTLDHSMLLLLEHGFEVYLPTEEQQIKLWPQSDLGDMEDNFPFSAEEWLKVPKARLVADRESKGGAGIGFIEAKARVSSTYDCFHDQWNHCKAGIWDAGLSGPRQPK